MEVNQATSHLNLWRSCNQSQASLWYSSQGLRASSLQFTSPLEFNAMFGDGSPLRLELNGWSKICDPVTAKFKHVTVIVTYHTTRTIFGKDQRMPATRYISYPTLNASLTHYIRQCVSIFYVDARVSPCVLPLKRRHAHVFSRNRGGFEQVVLFFVLTSCLYICGLLSARFVGSKSSHFAVLKTVR